MTAWRRHWKELRDAIGFAQAAWQNGDDQDDPEVWIHHMGMVLALMLVGGQDNVESLRDAYEWNGFTIKQGKVRLVDDGSSSFNGEPWKDVALLLEPIADSRI